MCDIYNKKYLKYKKKYLDIKREIEFRSLVGGKRKKNSPKKNVYENPIINRNHGGKYTNNDIKNNSIIKPNNKLLRYIFPIVPNVDTDKLLITSDSYYSVSGEKVSKVIADIIYYHTRNYDIVVTDMTANIGSDTIRLGLEFKKVYAFEINPITCSVLKKNIEAYHLQNKVEVFCENSVKGIEKLEQDVILIDPPWGGPMYKKMETVDIYLDGINIVDIIKRNIKTKFFVIKVPYNYNFNNFFRNIKPYNVIIYGIRQYLSEITSDYSNVNISDEDYQIKIRMYIIVIESIVVPLYKILYYD